MNEFQKLVESASKTLKENSNFFDGDNVRFGLDLKFIKSVPYAPKSKRDSSTGDYYTRRKSDGTIWRLNRIGSKQWYAYSEEENNSTDPHPSKADVLAELSGKAREEKKVNCLLIDIVRKGDYFSAKGSLSDGGVTFKAVGDTPEEAYQAILFKAKKSGIKNPIVKFQ